MTSDATGAPPREEICLDADRRDLDGLIWPEVLHHKLHVEETAANALLARPCGRPRPQTHAPDCLSPDAAAASSRKRELSRREQRRVRVVARTHQDDMSRRRGAALEREVAPALHD